MSNLNLTSKFCEFWETFSKIEKVVFNPDSTQISEEIFFHIFKIKQALWKHGENFNRRKRIAISDLLQEILAYYLKAALSDDFEIILEERIDKIQVDILIRFRQTNLFVIEVKTNLGWDRNSVNGAIENRINVISESFNIDKRNVIYVFQNPWNVNVGFRDRYWDNKNGKPANLSLEFPYDRIRPLFTGEDTYYFKEEHRRYFEDSEILGMARSRIIIPFELTVSEIINASNGTQ